MIKCDVIMDPKDVRQWLDENGRDGLVFVDPPKEISDVTVALLAEHAGGIGNVMLAVPEGDSFLLIRAPLALLENICVAMRAQIGEDPREDFVG